MYLFGEHGIAKSALDCLPEVNRLRALGISRDRSELEARLERETSPAFSLAVYGSLAPGQSNHHHLADLRGHWYAGLAVTGQLVNAGWAAGEGFPALRWAADAPSVPVHLLVSADLPHHWARLDEFEGRDYLRILVPVLQQQRVVAIANLYASRS